MTETLQLYPYQQTGVDWLDDHGRGILADDPGLGKTAQTIRALAAVGAQKTLIITCVKVAIGVWQDELPRWWPTFDEEAGGAGRVFVWPLGPENRQLVWEEFCAHDGPKVLLTNIHRVKFLRQMGSIELRKGDPAARRYAREWDAVIVDEAHKVNNHKTKQFDDVMWLKATHMYPLTATPLRKNGGDGFALFKMVNPDDPRFQSYWRFVHSYCNVVKTKFGIEIGGPKSAEQYQELARPHLLRRTKAKVLAELPPKTRQVIHVPMKPAQRHIYKQLVDEMMAELENEDGTPGIIFTPHKITQILRLRQLLVTPALIGGPHESAALEALAELAAIEFDAGRNIMVFTPFVQAFPYIRRVFEGKEARDAGCAADWIGEIKGGMSANQLTATVSVLQHGPQRRKVVINSILAATSFTGTAASVGFFLGYDWVPANNLQAEDRMHRIGQKDNVRINYFVAPGTIDQHIMKILDRRTTWDNLAMNPAALLMPETGRRFRYMDDETDPAAPIELTLADLEAAISDGGTDD